jgi:aspartate/methionine/tyrosine aminotransferase
MNSPADLPLSAAKNPFAATARPAVRALEASKIREVANAAMGREGLLPFWFGEPDQVTPDFIRAAAIASLDAGETFYSHSYGIPELRTAIAGYIERLHGACDPARVLVTNSGMHALTLINQALVAPGDRVVAVTPLWPNLTQGPKILGADVHTVPLRFGTAGWTLDLQQLLDALPPATRYVLINSPNNPTGWTMDAAAQAQVLSHCRRHGIWIVADDAYERLFFGNAAPAVPAADATAPATGPASLRGHATPSFLEIADPADRLVSANTFSKAWMMTGWRLGWAIAPAPLMPQLGKLVEYNICCSQVFVQRAGIAAVTQGDAATFAFVERLRRGRDTLIPLLNAIPGVTAVAPPGAMYAFFRIAGMADSLALCKHLAANHGLGLAPGAAFGPEGEGYIRWCFAASPERLAEGAARLQQALTAGLPA